VQHDRLAACVIAQQYSTATVVYLRFHSLIEKFGRVLKTLLCQFLYFFKTGTAETA
jgi:hypothetical protein